MPTSIPSFQLFYQRAIARKGSKKAIQATLPKIATGAELSNRGDDRYLAELTACVFRAGFVWRIINHKWAGFEEAFSGFVPVYWQQVPPERLEALARDERIVRNMQKIFTVPQNAQMIVEASEEHGSFGQFLAQWPSDNQVGLLLWLKKYGARLGGATAQHFLRRVGWDGYVLSSDVVTALENHNLLDASPTSKKGLTQVQTAFNAWHKETGLPFSHLSRILSYSVGA
ncbi:3-methyladenine DNA glycosylase [Aliidiomarina iranensis]|uniref:3-methyladenine DNA glycosylase n=1 Tax=Aliidiomarina iranensis TaxID=1434071 RepID=A0A432VRR0_9GAMM|nr:DNA-3-methyladenine glycosylase I [Aliidiomarina iranensis]RUO18997.1 3-methyladenine DNA glycosylase [Aliidiomarina iranensis]